MEDDPQLTWMVLAAAYEHDVREVCMQTLEERQSDMKKCKQPRWKLIKVVQTIAKISRRVIRRTKNPELIAAFKPGTPHRQPFRALAIQGTHAPLKIVPRTSKVGMVEGPKMARMLMLARGMKLRLECKNYSIGIGKIKQGRIPSWRTEAKTAREAASARAGADDAALMKLRAEAFRKMTPQQRTNADRKHFMDHCAKKFWDSMIAVRLKKQKLKPARRASRKTRPSEVYYRDNETNELFAMHPNHVKKHEQAERGLPRNDMRSGDQPQYGQSPHPGDQGAGETEQPCDLSSLSKRDLESIAAAMSCEHGKSSALFCSTCRAVIGLPTEFGGEPIETPTGRYTEEWHSPAGSGLNMPLTDFFHNMGDALTKVRKAQHQVGDRLQTSKKPRRRLDDVAEINEILVTNSGVEKPIPVYTNEELDRLHRDGERISDCSDNEKELEIAMQYGEDEQSDWELLTTPTDHDRWSLAGHEPIDEIMDWEAEDWKERLMKQEDEIKKHRARQLREVIVIGDSQEDSAGLVERGNCRDNEHGELAGGVTGKDDGKGDSDEQLHQGESCREEIRSAEPDGVNVNPDVERLSHTNQGYRRGIVTCTGEAYAEGRHRAHEEPCNEQTVMGTDVPTGAGETMRDLTRSALRAQEAGEETDAVNANLEGEGLSGTNRRSGKGIVTDTDTQAGGRERQGAEGYETIGKYAESDMDNIIDECIEEIFGHLQESASELYEKEVEARKGLRVAEDDSASKIENVKDRNECGNNTTTEKMVEAREGVRVAEDSPAIEESDMRKMGCNKEATSAKTDEAQSQQPNDRKKLHRAESEHEPDATESGGRTSKKRRKWNSDKLQYREDRKKEAAFDDVVLATLQAYAEAGQGMERAAVSDDDTADEDAAQPEHEKEEYDYLELQEELEKLQGMLDSISRGREDPLADEVAEQSTLDKDQVPDHLQIRPGGATLGMDCTEDGTLEHAIGIQLAGPGRSTERAERSSTDISGVGTHAAEPPVSHGYSAGGARLRDGPPCVQPSQGDKPGFKQMHERPEASKAPPWGAQASRQRDPRGFVPPGFTSPRGARHDAHDVCTHEGDADEEAAMDPPDDPRGYLRGIHKRPAAGAPAGGPSRGKICPKDLDLITSGRSGQVTVQDVTRSGEEAEPDELCDYSTTMQQGRQMGVPASGGGVTLDMERWQVDGYDDDGSDSMHEAITAIRTILRGTNQHYLQCRHRIAELAAVLLDRWLTGYEHRPADRHLHMILELTDDPTGQACVNGEINHDDPTGAKVLQALAILSRHRNGGTEAHVGYAGPFIQPISTEDPTSMTEHELIYELVQLLGTFVTSNSHDVDPFLTAHLIRKAVRDNATNFHAKLSAVHRTACWRVLEDPVSLMGLGMQCPQFTGELMSTLEFLNEMAFNHFVSDKRRRLEPGKGQSAEPS